MLTDRQFVALQLFTKIISKVFFVKRIKDTESIKKIADSALFYADIFLEQSAKQSETLNTKAIEKEFKNVSNGINIDNLKKLVLEKGVSSEEDFNLLNAFILNQLATYHSDTDPRLTPQQFINFWMGKTIDYLANDTDPTPSPKEFKQVIELFPPTINDNTVTLIQSHIQEVR